MPSGTCGPGSEHPAETPRNPPPRRLLLSYSMFGFSVASRCGSRSEKIPGGRPADPIGGLPPT
jgi:hypothetical protein